MAAVASNPFTEVGGDMGLLAFVLTASVTATAVDTPRQAAATEGIAGDGAAFVCDAVRVVGAAWSKQRSQQFSSKTTPDLVLRPRLRLALHGPHVVRLKVFTPRGFLYQEISVPVSAQAPDGSPSRATEPGGRVAGTGSVPVPDPATPGRPAAAGAPPSAAPEATRGPQARLPVAGTSITQSSLFGAWSVQPFLDDQTVPCGPTTTFTIVE